VIGYVCGLCFCVDYAPYVAPMAWTMLPLCCSVVASMLLLWPGLCGDSMCLPMPTSMVHLWATTRGISFLVVSALSRKAGPTGPFRPTGLALLTIPASKALGSATITTFYKDRIPHLLGGSNNLMRGSRCSQGRLPSFFDRGEMQACPSSANLL
jgi:hypothetical protein